MMLARVKLAMRISTNVFDAELLDLIAAGMADLRHCGVQFDSSEVKTQGVVTNYTVDDPLASTAIVTYCRMMFGSPSDFDRLKAAYEMQKGQMRESTAYGMEAL